ncbi:uncharacterized protein PAC_16510 [Phialocephala subalpina]|uniref:2EXR domain-containing protein n=1 Tax=Phialocephala subalpina TaxID=576137 RepID=A0A1L7XNJ9_9HELO|nr:uncharacterized protein PAC_16510 [Phialocephala subalpina]
MATASNEDALALTLLSRYTQRHLDLMRPGVSVSATRSPSGIQIDASQTASDGSTPALPTITLVAQSAQSSTNQGTDVETSPEFKFFLKLPTEMQDAIWKLWIESNPRIVHFGSKHNPPVAFRQISGQLRNEYQLHGYVEAKASWFDDDFATIFHTDVDILYFPPYAMVKPCCSYEYRITQALRHSNAFEKLRCVALPSTELTKIGYILRKLTNLELMIVSCETS